VHVGQAVADGAAAFGAFASSHACAEADLFGEDSDVAVGGVDQFPGSNRREAEGDQVLSMAREGLLGARVGADGFLVHGGWLPRAGFARGVPQMCLRMANLDVTRGMWAALARTNQVPSSRAARWGAGRCGGHELSGDRITWVAPWWRGSLGARGV
jgi:hypothetical protein